MFWANLQKMIRVGVTGQSGFIGTHLFNTLAIQKAEFELVPFHDEIFGNRNDLARFVASCDVIVHLAAMNRHGDPQVIYDTNIYLVKELIWALESTQSKAHILFSSSTQEERDNPYGNSKKEGRELLAQWAVKSGGGFTGLVIPNVFGPFGNPYYNSVIATFSHQINNNETPTINIDAQLNLIYVAELVNIIIQKIKNYVEGQVVAEYKVSHTASAKVTEILQLLLSYKSEYVEKGIIPSFSDMFQLNLFNTFRSYIDHRKHFPVKYVQHTDDRGAFVEILKLNGGGQVSFSTTKPGVTRGNHFHIRKIERFSVIKGKALIQLRKIGTHEVIDFYVSGDEPAYIDMPVWFTHNISNVGEEDLYTNFWINEFFNPEDPDTFFEKV